MTFEQAGAEYVRLMAAWQANQLTPSQFQAAAAQLRVVDSGGRWWQLDPAGARWLMWDGSAWAAPPPQAPPAAPPALAQPPISLAVPTPPAPAPRARGPMDGFISIIPGLAVELVQRGAYYKTHPMAAVQFLGPTLLSAVAMALAPRFGRVVAVLIVLACLGWLAWPLVGGWTGLAADPASGIRTNAGRGLAGMSMLYMIPRLWQAGQR